MISKTFFDSIQKHYKSKLPFVVYRNPKEIELKAFLQKNDTIYKVSDFTESGFVFSPFDDEKPTVMIPVEHSDSIHTEFEINSDPKSIQTNFLENKIARQNHISLIQKGINAINNHQFIKVVLSRQEEIKLNEDNPIHVLKRLLNAYISAFVYCWYHPKIGLWIGATPETLIKVNGNRFSTMALAGTKVYNGALDIEWQEKEKEEQQIVANFIIDSLKASVDDLDISKTITVKAGNLLHLNSEIYGTFNFKTSNLKGLLDILHPTPAVCGFPKAITKRFILENESYDREYYTGFLGELNVKEKYKRNSNKRNVENNAYVSIKTISNLFVNLRCMQLKNNTAILYVGGGITKDSNSRSEWQETVSKSLVMKNML